MIKLVPFLLMAAQASGRRLSYPTAEEALRALVVVGGLVRKPVNRSMKPIRSQPSGGPNMGLVNTAAPLFSGSRVAAGVGGPVADRIPSQEWVNVGRVMVSANEKAEISATFIGLPFGLGIDTMSQAKGTGYLTQAKNALLDEIREAFKGIGAGEEVVLGLDKVEVPKLKAGESTMLDGLFIQLRRVNDETSRPASDNPFLAAMSSNRLAVVK